ncbi:conserved oligomeric Golgi complex subunit 3-like [Sinocyclocheilus rhinocerous]|uniref:conserved oligomeric Golgi complex subunit 3-like n=1 Tax=Sinocyclocheilus rhinocerous TaxID=307959 RepID=UPI0007B9E03E|nr:PREDICTED: conserved oligomeric Golgi complex subunit 3-like [Sinocyclocheilus rhinocerous]
MASSTEQSLLELTDKETREKLSHWDRRGDPMAPLTEKQTDSVLEIRAAAEVALLPAEMNCAFLRRKTRDVLSVCQEQCDSILSDVNAALERLDSLQKQYLFVSTKTGTLHEACEQLLKEQSELVDLAESIQQKLSYFNELENINTKLNSPTLSVNSEGFIPMLSKLDECIEYVSSHPHFKDYPVYLTKFRQCLSRAMLLIKSHTVSSLQNLTAQLTKRDPLGAPNADNAFTLYYVKFRAAAPKVRSELVDLAESIQQKLSYFNELENINTKLNSPTLSVNSEGFIPMLSKLDECIEYVSSHPHFKDYPVYLTKFRQCLSRAMLLIKSHTVSSLQNLTAQLTKRDPLGAPNADNAFTLYYVKFRAAAPKVRRLIEQVEQRSNKIPEYQQLLDEIHQCYLEQREVLLSPCINATITDLTSQNNKMTNSYINDLWQIGTNVQLAAFDAVVKQMLEDVQERLVYRTHIYIQTDILGYKPAPGDLAYPDKLEMMEKIAQSLKEEQMKLTSSSSFSDVQLEESDNKKLVSSDPRAHSTVSPADLHGMWYPTVRRTLVCLSKLYRCIDRAVFQGLSQEALSACIQSLLKASDIIQKNKNQIDGQLFLIKHLLIMREQIAPFHADFAIKEISLDLKKTRAKINDIVMATYRILKTKLPITLQSLSLYLANKDTEFILFKPVRNNVQQVFQRLHALLQKEYSGEDLQIIACPSMEQINLLLSVK